MCGIMGVIGAPQSAQEVYQGLLLLQHRGQDAAGILSYDFNKKNFNQYKDQGLVADVFDSAVLDGLKGQMSIGHTRYATVGPKTPIDAKRDIQPMAISYPFGIGLVHNGNIVNYYELKKQLQEVNNRHLFTQNDLEVLLNFLAEGLILKPGVQAMKFNDLERAVEDIFKAALGGYSVLGLLGGYGLFAFRDPMGIRPLVLGKRPLTENEKKESPGKEWSYCFSSETNALNFLGYQLVRDIEPGEIILINQDGEIQSTKSKVGKNADGCDRPCMFEWVYFSNPESIVAGKSVYGTRLEFGRKLAEEIRPLIESKTITPDLIVPIPETSRVAAIGMSEALDIPYREVLIKNRYIQRSFILNTPESRKRAVQLKLTAIAQEIKGKNILLLDDSVVRGTTSQRIIEMVREAGARQVYFASTCPPIRYPCYYGIDFPDPTELIAHDKSEEQVAELLGADKLIYLSESSLRDGIAQKSICMACVNGKYPVDVSAAESFKRMRSMHREEQKQ